MIAYLMFFLEHHLKLLFQTLVFGLICCIQYTSARRLGKNCSHVLNLITLNIRARDFNVPLSFGRRFATNSKSVKAFLNLPKESKFRYNKQLLVVRVLTCPKTFEQLLAYNILSNKLGHISQLILHLPKPI